MANTLKKVRDDIIPLRAGIVRLTPLDANLAPDYSKAITTNRNYLTSTQVTVSRTSESLANGNGQDKEMPTDETFTLALITNSYNPDFHATASGLEVVADEQIIPVLRDNTITVTKTLETYTYVFPEDENAPVASPDGKYHFEIRDSFGNLFKDITDGDEEVLGEGNYQYDPDTKTLTFAAQYENVSFKCVYYIAATGSKAYQAPTTLKTATFQVEVMGEVQSADSGEHIRYYAKMARAVISGDLPNIMTQKSLTNSMTYTFKTSPVPEGMTAFYDSFTPITTK